MHELVDRLRQHLSTSPKANLDSNGKVLRWVLVIAAASFVLLAVLIQVAATLLIRDEQGLTTVDRLKSINDVRTSLIQLLGGLGLVGGLVYTAKTFSLGRATQRADRFAKAIERIGDNSETVRVGAVYSLWSVCLEAETYWPTVEQVLCALLRERAKTDATLTADVQAAATVVGGRPSRPAGARGLPLDLRNVNLAGANLARANLERVRLDNAILNGANLTDVKFRRASLTETKFGGADLASAELIEADLSRASLIEGANLWQTVFTGATISDCDFGGARNLTREQLAKTSGEPAAVPWES